MDHRPTSLITKKSAATKRRSTPERLKKRSFCSVGTTRLPRKMACGHRNTTKPMIPGIATSIQDIIR